MIPTAEEIERHAAQVKDAKVKDAKAVFDWLVMNYNGQEAVLRYKEFGCDTVFVGKLLKFSEYGEIIIGAWGAAATLKAADLTSIRLLDDNGSHNLFRK